MTLVSDIVRTVSRSFGDTDNIVATPADYLDWVNAGQLKIARETECLTVLVTPAASTFPWSFPVDFMKIKRVAYGQYEIEEVQLNDLDLLGASLTQTSTPLYYYIRNRKINLFPLQQASDTTLVAIDYASVPTKVTAVGNSLTIPDIYIDDLHNFVLAKARERNEDFRGMEVAETRFNQALGKDKQDDYSKSDTYPIIRDDSFLDYWA